jgi:adenylate cyclase
VARSSTIRYRERTNDPAILASELGVRYLLEGSVRVVGSRIRVAVHLMDAGSGTSIWAEHFDRDKENIFDLQDEITEQAVGAIEPTIRKAEIELSRRKRPESLEAYDLVMRALPLMLEMTSGASQEALRLASEAARLDPGYARAHAMAAWCHAWMVAHEWAEDRAAARSDGMKFAHTALRLDGDDPTVLTMVSTADTLLMGDLESAGAHVAKALAIDPNSAWGWVRSGYVQIYLGNVDAALEHFQRAERLSPYDVLSFNLYVGRSLAHFTAARYREAAEWAGMALAERPGLPGALRMMTAAQAMLGRMEEARSTVGALLVECPGSTIKSALDSLPIRRPDARERLVGALKSAGLPEA